ncbi:MAG: hypothetical protein ACYSUB_15190 [Planctomycetota bacterium]
MARFHMCLHRALEIKPAVLGGNKGPFAYSAAREDRHTRGE